jgi:hypothetical protein
METGAISTASPARHTAALACIEQFFPLAARLLPTLFMPTRR